MYSLRTLAMGTRLGKVWTRWHTDEDDGEDGDNDEDGAFSWRVS